MATLFSFFSKLFSNMVRQRVSYFIAMTSCVLLIIGCSGGGSDSDVVSIELPTVQSTAAVVLPATHTPEPTDPSLGLPATFTPAPPEPTFTPTATRDASLPTETPTPDMRITAEVNLTTGLRDPFVMGETIQISGRAQLRSDQRMEAALVSLDGRVLAAELVEVGQFNTWEANLTVPNQLSGQARVLVGIANPDGQMAALEELLVTILPRTEGETRYLLLDQPDEAATASAGYYFYFSGRAERPARNVVVIEIRTDECSTQASKHTLVLNGSGAWEGFVQVPVNVTAEEVCAVAYFGEEGSAERREFQWLVPVRPYVDKAPAVAISAPAADSEIQAGVTLSIYGTAAHAPNDEVRVTMTYADGSVAATETATVDPFGYWETSILVPVSGSGELQLQAAVGADGADEAVQTIFVTIPPEEES